MSEDDLADRLAALGSAPVPALADVDQVRRRGQRRRARRRAAVAGVGAVVVLAAGGTAYGLLSPGGADETLQPAVPPATTSQPVTPSPAPSASPSPTAVPPPVSPPARTPSGPPSPTRSPAVDTPAPAAVPTPVPTAVPTSAPAPTGLRPGDRLMLSSIGAVRTGMTWAQVEAATGRTARYDDFGGCSEGGLSGGAPEIGLLAIGGKVARIEGGPGVRTASGVGIGDSEARVRQVYPTVEVRPSYYLPQGHWLVVHPAGSPYELLFETDGATVTAFRSGLVSPVEAPEGCH